MNNKELIEQIARFVSEEWDQQDIARGIRLQFAATTATTAPSDLRDLLPDTYSTAQGMREWAAAQTAPSDAQKPTTPTWDERGDVCLTCGHKWNEHDFGVPTPYCP